MALSRLESLAKKLAADGDFSRADGREVSRLAVSDKKVTTTERKSLEKIAASYQDQFDVGGSRAVRELLSSPVNHVPAPLEVLGKDPFTPDNLAERFVDIVGKADTSIDAAFFQVLDPQVVDALADASERGVNVRLVTDDDYFDAQDSQDAVDHRVKVKGEINEIYKTLKWTDLKAPDAQAQLAALKERLDAIETEIPSTPWLKDSLIPDIAPAREYLNAALAGQLPDRTQMSREQGEISSELSHDKVLQNYRPAYDKLLQAGVEIRDDDDGYLSHNKYMVLDDSVVWTGSYNLQGLKSDRDPTKGLPMTADNVVIMKSGQLADAYQADFEQMISGKFHDDKTPSALDGVTVDLGDGVKVTPYFSPNKDVPDRLAEKLEGYLADFKERKAAGTVKMAPTIRLAGFTFSYKGMERIVNALAELKAQGADVNVILGGSTARASYSAYHQLTAAGIQVDVAHSSTMMHNKFLSLEDGKNGFVWTGSANFTGPAYDDNDESVALIDSAEVAREYERIFDSLRDNLEDPPSERT